MLAEQQGLKELQVQPARLARLEPTVPSVLPEQRVLPVPPEPMEQRVRPGRKGFWAPPEQRVLRVPPEYPDLPGPPAVPVQPGLKGLWAPRAQPDLRDPPA